MKLKVRPSRAAVRRVCCREKIVILPDVQMSVPIRLVYTNLHAPSSDWLVEPKQVKPGLLIGRTLLPNVDECAAVCVINLSGAEQCIKSGCYLGEAESVPADWTLCNINSGVSRSCTVDRTVNRDALVSGGSTNRGTGGATPT